MGVLGGTAGVTPEPVRAVGRGGEQGRRASQLGAGVKGAGRAPMAEVGSAGHGRHLGFLVFVFSREHNRLTYTAGQSLERYSLEQMQQRSGETQPCRQKGWRLGCGVLEGGLRRDPIKQNGRLCKSNNYSIFYGFGTVRLNRCFL